MHLTDTHCHLDFARFDLDRGKVIEKAVERGLERILVPGIDLASSQAAIQIAEKYPQVYAAVGVHPNSGKTWEASTLNKLKSIAQHPKVVAIGEIGLDYFRDWTPRDVQKIIFKLQMELAKKLKLPVIIHSRESYNDIFGVITKWHEKLVDVNTELAERSGVFHSYSGNIMQAHNLIDANFYIGISGPVTFKKADSLRQVAAELPLERILIETDSPFLSPHPHRGKRNEPANVYYIAEKIAYIRNITPTQVGEITTENGENLFNW